MHEGRDPEVLADMMIDELPERTTLVYIEQGDRLTDEQVQAYVADDYEALYESIEEWESDAVNEGAWCAVEQAARDAGLTNEEYDEVRCTDDVDSVLNEAYNRDDSDVIEALARSTPSQLFAINLGYVKTADDIITTLAGHGVVDADSVAREMMDEQGVAYGANLEVLVMIDLDVAKQLNERGGTIKGAQIALIDHGYGTSYDVRVSSVTVEPGNVYLDGAQGYGADDICGLVKSAYRPSEITLG